jgi:hypothetical protein
MVPQILRRLEFRSNNEHHLPVLSALDLLKRYADSKLQTFPAEEVVPIDDIVRGLWREAVVEKDAEGRQRINRITYEICVLAALREKLRFKEVWVFGAGRYRNPDEDLPAIIARYSENERQTRVFGSDMQGEGAVFTTSVDALKYQKDPREFPEWCRWIWGSDFSHGGMSASAHPFAAALLCHDTMTDIVYVVDAVRLYRALPAMHVQAIRGRLHWDAPFAWPHDGNRGADLATSETFRGMYRRLGLNMRPNNASFKDGGYALEAGITEMEQRFASNRLKIASHLTEVLDEYIGYHRINNLIHKVDDDLLSAIRIGLMDIRYAKPMGPTGRGPDGSFDHRGSEQRIARDVDFDVFTGFNDSFG